MFFDLSSFHISILIILSIYSSILFSVSNFSVSIVLMTFSIARNKKFLFLLKWPQRIVLRVPLPLFPKPSLPNEHRSPEVLQKVFFKKSFSIFNSFSNLIRHFAMTIIVLHGVLQKTWEKKASGESIQRFSMEKGGESPEKRSTIQGQRYLWGENQENGGCKRAIFRDRRREKLGMGKKCRHWRKECGAPLSAALLSL